MSERKPSQRFHSLNTEQVEVLHQVLSEVVPIHGRGNFPTLELRPRDIIIAVRARLLRQGITVRDVRLNGSTASHVLVRDNGTSYKDLDIIFGVELPSQEEFQVIKESVLGCLLDCLPAGVNRERISSATMKEAYVQKMVKVFNEHDRWSLISLSNNSGKNLELKFVSVLRRQFEFSVDSFQIILDRLLESYMQQETQQQHRTGAAEPREETAAPRSGPANDPAGGEGVGRTQQRDEVQEKESQTEFTQQSEQKKHSTPEKDNEEETPAEMKEASEQREDCKQTEQTEQTSLNLSSKKRRTSEEAEPPAHTELRHEPELRDENERSAEAERTEPEDGRRPAQRSAEEEPADRTEPPDEQREEPAEQPGRAETPATSEETQGEAGSAERSDEANASPRLGEEEDEIQQASAADADASPGAADESRAEPEICEEKSDMDANELAQEISASETKRAEDAADTDRSGSGSSSLSDAPEIHSTQHTDNSDRTANALDAVSPPNTQDILPTPPSLVSDKKTSCSSASSKASERLSHMVVLKHSSPKPPRRMCRKVTPSPAHSPVPEADLPPCLSPEAESPFDPKPTAPGPDPTAPPTSSPPTKADSGSDETSSDLDFTSAPDPGPDVIPSAAVDPESTLPQEPAPPQPPTDGPCETRCPSPADPGGPGVSAGEESPSSPGEDASGPDQSEPRDSGDPLVSDSDPLSSDPPEPEHTSAAELSDRAENTADQNVDATPTPSDGLPEPDHSPSSSFQCLTPPVLSLSPPCFSPPPCLTPPPHCLPSSTLSTISPATSFGSPALSFSPASSCLSSPPYLTPPMLSLSPPPLCLTPPSPCLSPPLLCLTPPVESEDLVAQGSPDLEPLMLNTDGGEPLGEPLGEPSAQAAAPEQERDYVSSPPQVSEPVSFPIAIPSSGPQVLPRSQTGDSGEPAPPRAAEASGPAPEDKEAPRATTTAAAAAAAAEPSGKCDAPRAPDSVPDVEVLAESMYGDFEAAMDHLRYRLIATRNPEEIRGGGLLKYSNLLVRDYRPASETQIKTLERYMCSRFFIDFPDVQEQQRKILSYLKNHFIGEERSKYQYLMTLRRVVDDSTVCLMGHERRQTLNMITVLALKVLGEQNIIPNTDHVTCFYQPAPYLAEHSAPYLAEPSYCSYYIPQGGSTLLYQPYPLHLHPQTGLV